MESETIFVGYWVDLGRYFKGAVKVGVTFAMND